MKLDIMKRNQIIIPYFKWDGWDKVLRNMKYLFISVSVVLYRNFKARLISLSRDLFPAQDANTVVPAGWLTEQETCGEIHRPITHSPRFPPIDTRFFDTNNK